MCFCWYNWGSTQPHFCFKPPTSRPVKLQLGNGDSAVRKRFSCPRSLPNLREVSGHDIGCTSLACTNTTCMCKMVVIPLTGESFELFCFVLRVCFYWLRLDWEKEGQSRIGNPFVYYNKVKAPWDRHFKSLEQIARHPRVSPVHLLHHISLNTFEQIRPWCLGVFYLMCHKSTPQRFDSHGAHAAEWPGQILALLFLLLDSLRRLCNRWTQILWLGRIRSSAWRGLARQLSDGWLSSEIQHIIVYCIPLIHWCWYQYGSNLVCCNSSFHIISQGCWICNEWCPKESEGYIDSY